MINFFKEIAVNEGDVGHRVSMFTFDEVCTLLETQSDQHVEDKEQIFSCSSLGKDGEQYCHAVLTQFTDTPTEDVETFVKHNKLAAALYSLPGHTATSPNHFAIIPFNKPLPLSKVTSLLFGLLEDGFAVGEDGLVWDLTQPIPTFWADGCDSFFKKIEGDSLVWENCLSQ